MYSQLQKGSSFQAADKSVNPATDEQPSQESHSNAGKDSLSLSPDAKKIAEQQAESGISQEKGTDQKPLTEEELLKVTELQQRDTEVRTHEQAHLSAAGAYASGGASFSFTTGPNGKRYATSGEVPIDMSKEDTPEATILKMQTVRRAALAPASPSSADRSIAAQASSKELQARKELQNQEDSSSEAAPAQGYETAEKNTDKNSASVAAVSDYRRTAMASAYQAMAALAN
jgi:hypothetical protein